MKNDELHKRIMRFFFALDHFYENGLSEYWLSEMKYNRRLIEDFIKKTEEEESDKKQLKIFK